MATQLQSNTEVKPALIELPVSDPDEHCDEDQTLSEDRDRIANLCNSAVESKEPSQNPDIMKAEFERLLFGRDSRENLYLKLGNFALQQVGNKSAAEDLLHEVVWKAFKNFHRFRLGSNFSAWMFRIMVNQICNHKRRERSYRRLFNAGIRRHVARETCHAPAPKSPEEMLITAEPFSEEVMQALDKIREERRELIILVDLAEFTYEEAAAHLGIEKVGTVMSRLFRGRKALRNLLREYARTEYSLKATKDTKSR
jgi:RNA polymerase sigma-70 factor (ECF subfamily)